MCFHCGKYRHKDVNCPTRSQTGENVEAVENMQVAGNDPPIHQLEVTKEFGPWMLAQQQ